MIILFCRVADKDWGADFRKLSAGAALVGLTLWLDHMQACFFFKNLCSITISQRKKPIFKLFKSSYFLYNDSVSVRRFVN